MNEHFKIVFNNKVKKVLSFLKNSKSKKDKVLLNSIIKKLSIIEKNSHYGNSIKKSLIPKKYKFLGVKNLFRVELAHFWRMLYTITNNEEDEIVVLVLEILNHEDYNKLFGYKNK